MISFFFFFNVFFIFGFVSFDTHFMSVWGICCKAMRDWALLISFLTVNLWVSYSEELFPYPPVFYCQFVYTNCTLMSFVYTHFLLSSSALIFPCPKTCTLCVCLLSLTSRSDPLFSPFCSWPLQQGQTSIVKGFDWDFFSIPSLSFQFHFSIS